MDRIGCHFEVLQTWKEIEPLLDEIYDIEASGWKGERGTAIKQVPEMRCFYTQLAETAASAGTMRLFVLRKQDGIIAFEFNLLTGSVLYLLKKGFLEGERKHSPGQVLLLQVVRWAFNDPDISFYDMLGNSRMRDPSKERFITEDYPLYRLRIFNRSTRGVIAWGMYPDASAGLGRSGYAARTPGRHQGSLVMLRQPAPQIGGQIVEPGS